MIAIRFTHPETPDMRVYPDHSVIEEAFKEVLWVTGNRYVFEPYADLEFEYEDGYANAVYIDEGDNYRSCCGLMGQCQHGERECVPFAELSCSAQRDILRLEVNWWDYDQLQGFTVAQRDKVIENIVAGSMPNRWLEGVAIQEAQTDKRLTKPEKTAEVLGFPKERTKAGSRDFDLEP